VAANTEEGLMDRERGHNHPRISQPKIKAISLRDVVSGVREIAEKQESIADRFILRTAANYLEKQLTDMKD